MPAPSPARLCQVLVSVYGVACVRGGRAERPGVGGSRAACAGCSGVAWCYNARVWDLAFL
eukprot:scaffold494_cov117-Isochrysis_galbana.AAC.9